MSEVSSPEVLKSRCPSCDSKDWLPCFRLRDRFEILRCQGCGLLRSAGTPLHGTGQDEFAAIDINDYFKSMAPIRRQASNRILDRIQIKEKGDRILDIGCSFGWFLGEANRRGWETFGIEPSQVAFDYATKSNLHQIHHGLFPANGFPGITFDAVVLMDVIEHLPDPVTTVTDALQILKPGGMLCIKVPNQGGIVYGVAHCLAKFGLGDSPVWRLWQLDFPYPHLWYFTPESLSKVITNAGLEVESAETIPAVTISSIPKRIAYILGNQPAIAKLMLPFYIFGLGICAIGSKLTGRNDSCIVYARRPL